MKLIKKILDFTNADHDAYVESVLNVWLFIGLILFVVVVLCNLFF